MLSRNEILQQNTLLFRDVLDNDDILLRDETTAADVAEWDSLTHIQLMAAVEKHYKIRFTTRELMSFQNVGELCDSIVQKLAALPVA